MVRPTVVAGTPQIAKRSASDTAVRMRTSLGEGAHYGAGPCGCPPVLKDPNIPVQAVARPFEPPADGRLVAGAGSDIELDGSVCRQDSALNGLSSRAVS